MVNPTEVIRTHIQAPYSAEALGVVLKEVVETDPVDLSGLPHESTGFSPALLKRSYGSPTIADQPEVYQGLHQTFCGAVREVIGDELFGLSRIYFDHWHHVLRPGQARTFATPHLDGCAPGGYNDGAMNSTGESGAALKVVGTVSNTLPTLVFQGSTAPSDYLGETRTILKPLAEHRLDPIETATNRIVLTPPSLPHAAQVASELTARSFLRWQLMIDL